ncbi:unnamed protein product [Rhizoctonia solani]|uniref:F-box domain-containing protein n=1 Tax=Rhizoctonia solani TaxID=456999 RepID=A0A8H3BJR3_9AGAM|nr:unnamed protein product [Rhizoctonia solani]
MSAQDFSPIFPLIQEWEQAGLSLWNALNKYIKLGDQLERKAIRGSIHPNHLTARLDVAMHSLHAVLNEQLVSAHATLARTRNRISSVFHYLPHEILTRIFATVLYERFPINQVSSSPISMEKTILTLFRDFYSLQSVCHAWRDVILSQGLFWYFAPIYCSSTPRLLCNLAPELSLERSNGVLYLAAAMQLENRKLVSNLPISSRFHKVNLAAESYSLVRLLVERLLETGPPFTLTELSLYERKGCVEGNRVNNTTVLPSTSFFWGTFCELLESLSVFRVRGAHFDWNHMAFSHRLVHIRLQEVFMGSDTVGFVQFLRKLTLAPNLRKLEIISVSTSLEEHPLATIEPKDILHFPSLDWLLIEDLTYNALLTALGHISPGSHCLILFLSGQAIELEGEPNMSRLMKLTTRLKDHHVDTLILSEEWGRGRLSHFGIHTLWHSLRGLKSLKLSGWTLGESECRTIISPQVKGTQLGDKSFPHFQCLDLSRVQIRDEEQFKQVVTSYPIRRMVLGGSICKSATEPPEFEPLQENHPIINWLRLNVPDFTLRSEYALPSEHFSSVWQLW